MLCLESRIFIFSENYFSYLSKRNYKWVNKCFQIVLLLIYTLCCFFSDCIHRKTNLDHLNRGGWTPLMYAAYVGRDNILNMLLDAGARIDIQSKKVKLGSTALMLASYCATESIMYFLLQVSFLFELKHIMK